MIEDLVAQMLGATRAARASLPVPRASTLVVDGQRVEDVRGLRDDDPDELARRRAELRRARDRARYDRLKHDPEFQAKRRAWYLANREKVRAYKRAYDQRTKERQRKQKADWARRTYALRAEERRAASRAYYARNRERILATKKAKQAAARETCAMLPAAPMRPAAKGTT